MYINSYYFLKTWFGKSFSVVLVHYTLKKIVTIVEK